MRSTIQLSGLCAVFRCIAPSLALNTETIYGPSDPSRYMFYDATPECKNTTDPCITNFKYCSNIESHSQYMRECPEGATLDKSSTWIDLEGSQVFWWADTLDPIAVFDTTRWARSNYTLKWVNTNPQYNTSLYLIPQPGALYDTFDDYFEPQTKLRTIVPAGKTEYNFSFHDLLQVMEPLHPNLNRSTTNGYNLLDEMKYSMLASWSVAFAIAQPDDPKHDGRLRTDTVAKSSVFRWSTDLVRDIITEKEKGDEAEAHERESKQKNEANWEVGVGLGVGLGFPIMAAVMFFLGVRYGRKHGEKSGDVINLDVAKPPED